MDKTRNPSDTTRNGLGIPLGQIKMKHAVDTKASYKSEKQAHNHELGYKDDFNLPKKKLEKGCLSFEKQRRLYYTVRLYEKKVTYNFARIYSWKKKLTKNILKNLQLKAGFPYFDITFILNHNFFMIYTNK